MCMLFVFAEHVPEEAAAVVRAMRGRGCLSELAVALRRVRGQASGVLRVHACAPGGGAGAVRLADMRGLPESVLRELPGAHL